uniref:ZP domain-containing protein n=1 Tax=Lates calcarifer TaxID=8187 RepID=A0A4W6CI78_LATCA
KDGFLGDGLTCYNTKLCSFNCLKLSSSTRSGPSSQSVQFNCGNTVCPLGMDCISNNATARCADPCEYYTVLDDDWRSTNNTVNQITRCDRDVSWQGWYRLFLGQTSAHIPERCIDRYRCGTHAPLWITEPHPTQSGVIVNRIVCNAWAGSCCYFSSHTIHVKLCYGNYYVYKLVKPSTFLLQPTQLICGRDKLQVGLNLVAMTSTGLNPFSGNLASRNCSWVRVLDDVVWYEVEAQAGACGNTLRTNRTHAIYSNSLFIYPTNVSFARPVSLPFSCAYPLDTDTSLNVAIRPFLPLSGSGTKARASMSLFRNSNFTEPYPAGLISLPVGSPLYVGVSVEERDPSFALVLVDCYATHSSNPDDPTRYFLIQNKCPTDRRQVSVVESGSSLQARFSALLFLFQGEYRDIYLHCSLSLCDRRSSCVRVISLTPAFLGLLVWWYECL